MLFAAAGLFGRGLYFANDPGKSHNYNAPCEKVSERSHEPGQRAECVCR